MKLRLLCGLILLVGGKVFAEGGLNINKEIKTISQFGDKLIIEIEKGKNCVAGGTHLTMHDKYVVKYLSFSCLNEKEVDEIIQALEQAKTELKKIQEINEKSD